MDVCHTCTGPLGYEDFPVDWERPLDCCGCLSRRARHGDEFAAEVLGELGTFRAADWLAEERRKGFTVITGGKS
jgi:hypothetical protein